MILPNVRADQCSNKCTSDRNQSTLRAKGTVYLIQQKLCKRSWFSNTRVTSRPMKPTPIIDPLTAMLTKSSFQTPIERLRESILNSFYSIFGWYFLTTKAHFLLKT